MNDMDSKPLPIKDARQRGWFWIDNHVIDDYASKIGPIALALYVTLVRHADGNGLAFPSLSRLSTLLSLSRQSVWRYLMVLRDHDLITIQHRRSKSGSHLNNYYFICTPRSSEDPPRSSEDPPRSSEDPPRSSELHEGIPREGIPREQDPGKEGSGEPPRAHVPDNEEGMRLEAEPRARRKYRVDQAWWPTPNEWAQGARDAPHLDLELATKKFKLVKFQDPILDPAQEWLLFLIRDEEKYLLATRASPRPAMGDTPSRKEAKFAKNQQTFGRLRCALESDAQHEDTACGEQQRALLQLSGGSGSPDAPLSGHPG